MIMKRYLLMPAVLCLLFVACGGRDKAEGHAAFRTELTRTELLDKIKGGWAGQVIGCTFGGPTEFRYQGVMIQDHQDIPWDDSLVAMRFEKSPGLYDDVYMDLTFVDVMAREGIDAPAASHARAFANAGYPLWHANQAARYNILNGILPPGSGHWLNTPHADDIDFQIEADFAGLMSPGMVNAGAEVCDRIGHIMNFGDGWYGGVYVAAMYSLAFVSRDVEYVVEEGLKVLPPESTFARCIRDVVACYRADPGDWKRAWSEVERKWAQDIGCPDFVLPPGTSTPGSTGPTWSSACSTAGAISAAPSRSRRAAARIPTAIRPAPAASWAPCSGTAGSRRFGETRSSPSKTNPSPTPRCRSTRSMKRASIRRCRWSANTAGAWEGRSSVCLFQPIRPVPLETSFAGCYPIERKRLGLKLETSAEIGLRRHGLCPDRPTVGDGRYRRDPYVYRIELVLDDRPPVVFGMPVNELVRRLEISWAYLLRAGKHTIKLRILNPRPGGYLQVDDLITYGDKPGLRP